MYSSSLDTGLFYRPTSRCLCDKRGPTQLLSLTSDQMLSLPEVCDLGGVVVVDGVHAAVLQPVCRGYAPALHLHGVDSGVPAELQDHQARHHLPTCECCVHRPVQLQPEALYGTQRHFCWKHMNH